MSQPILFDYIKRNHHRFHFFFVLIIATAISFGFYLTSIISIKAQTIPTPTPVGGGKQVLTQNDFSYVGAFYLPGSGGMGGDPTYSKGLAHRYVNGELRMFSFTWNPQNLYEVRVPIPTTTNYPQAAFIKNWGTITSSKIYGHLFGLYWDNPDQRLYWNDGSIYNATTHNDPSVGYSVLNDSAGTKQDFGPWSFAPRGYKNTMGCTISIPQWFANAYTGGKRLGAGCGGYWSIITVGGVSMGPSMLAFDPPTASNPEKSALPYTSLVHYPFSNNPINCNARANRDIDYTDKFDGCNPTGGVGHWTWADYIHQGGIWVDTPTKSGLLFFPNIGNGNVYYQTSTLHADRSSIGWYIYDPTDLAKVAQGQLAQSAIQPKSFWNANIPGLGTALPGWADGPKYQVVGTTFDPVSNRLYIAVSHDENTKYARTKVHVYQVGGGGNIPTPSSTPSPTPSTSSGPTVTPSPSTTPTTTPTTTPIPTATITPTPTTTVITSPTPIVSYIPGPVSQDVFSNFTFQMIPKILSGLACYFVRFGIIAAVIAILASGIAFLLSRGNPVGLANAKKFLLYAIVGALVIYGVYTIILSVSLLVTGSTNLPWVPLTCS